MRSMTQHPVEPASRAVRLPRTVPFPRRDRARTAEGPHDPARGVVSRGCLVLSPWLALCGKDAVEIRDPRSPAVHSLAPGTTVVLLCDRPLSRWRLRRLAARAGVEVDRELIGVPSTRRPVVLLDDEESAVHHFWNDVVTVPPGLASGSLPATVALRIARTLPWAWTGALLPGRVVIGRRT